MEVIQCKLWSLIMVYQISMVPNQGLVKSYRFYSLPHHHLRNLFMASMELIHGHYGNMCESWKLIRGGMFSMELIPSWNLFRIPLVNTHDITNPNTYTPLPWI